MKKKLFGVTVVAIVAIAAAWNVSENKNGVSLTNLTLENVEALASGESGGRGTLYGNSSGTRYCCCSGSNSCGASACAGC